MLNIPAVQGTNVRHGMLIRLTVNGTVYRLANTWSPITFNGENYQALGHFLGVNQMQDDLKITNNSIQLSISGIPKDASEPDTPNYMGLILDERIKGSKVQIYRIFFNPTTNELLSGQTSLRFSGYISNFNLSDSVDIDSRSGTNNIVVECSSIHAILEKKISGRRTNSTDQKGLYPSDTGMDRVVAISQTAFDFGKPYTAPSPATPTDIAI